MMRAANSSLPDEWVALGRGRRSTPGRAVHLGDDDPLGAVDDEGALLGHERDVAHVDVLLLDVLDERAWVSSSVSNTMRRSFTFSGAA